jgi:hypothetical protein
MDAYDKHRHDGGFELIWLHPFVVRDAALRLLTMKGFGIPFRAKCLKLVIPARVAGT